MKFIKYILLLAIVAGFTQCCKEKPTNSNNNNIPGLPPATQAGANTLGFLLNGVPWVPAGNNGTANLSIDFDPGFNNGILNIVAYNFMNITDEQFTISIRDSLNFMAIPITIQLSRNSLYSISFRNNCDYWNQMSDVISTGSFTINKLDRGQQIISGIFNATLSKAGCQTIKITEGRFDMKF